MFIAIQAKDRTRVTSIDPEWDDEVEVLRELAHSGKLLCPGCDQLIWLRTGTRRRRHFAHRSLADCPLEEQSPAVWEAKAQLYLWLKSKYPGKVKLDTAIGVPGLDRNVDLVVEPEPGRKFAYWVFDRQQRDRDSIYCYRSLEGLHVHFIHTFSTLVEHAPNQVVLTASQRDFIGASEFDTCVARGDTGHLLFFRTDDSTVLIYRGLHCVHRPNVYTWGALREGTLASARISPKTGEIVVAEDVTARLDWSQKLREEKRSDPAPHRGAQPIGQAALIPHPAPEAPCQAPASGQEPATKRLNLNGPFRCEDCGIETTDWSSATPSAGTCLCRSCSKERWRHNVANPPTEEN